MPTIYQPPSNPANFALSSYEALRARAAGWIGRISGGGRHPRPSNALSIPSADLTAETDIRKYHCEKGWRLAAQGRWNRLSEKLSAADVERVKTPAGKPVAQLLSRGARLVLAPKLDRIVLDGLGERDVLIRVLCERAATDHLLAAVLVVAHVEAARSGDTPHMPGRDRAHLAGLHLQAADRLMKPFETAERGSPLLAAADCMLIAAGKDTERDLSQGYALAIDLDPSDPGPMRALGRRLVASANADLARLEGVAVQTAARTREFWGEGGYTWVMLDALRRDPDVLSCLDAEFFIDGMRDILARDRSQATVNLLAAACAAVENQQGIADPRGRANRDRLVACSDWIVRDHLRELHPALWLAGQPRNRSPHAGAPLRRSPEAARETALNFIARRFGRELAAGHRVVFTPNGPETLRG
ncbi:hypothetical protein AB1M95_06040 [Sulfitobacter sp. LCG007]